MSKVYENDHGVFISHKKYIDALYTKLNEKQLHVNPSLFKILSQYNSNRNKKKPNTCDRNSDVIKEHEKVKQSFLNFMKKLTQENLLPIDNGAQDNRDALKAAEFVCNATSKQLPQNVSGANIGPPTMKVIDGSTFLFPENATFFSKDIAEIGKDLSGKKFDMILLDPPWWNKYIRRKRKKSDDAYNMLYNNELKNIPVNNLLNDDGMVVVWCTNSLNNLNDLLTVVFKEWNVHFCGKWYWIKITTSGEPVCNFSLPPGKQPYEKIIFGCRKHPCPFSSDGRIVVSVPSAIHSHKPPLVELLQPFLVATPSCLEVFARYLLSGWTSYGNEVLKLQHESLFIQL